MAERSATFDTFKQHTYVPNKLYSVLNLARAAILDDLAAEIQTAAPAHSAAAINEASRLPESSGGRWKWPWWTGPATSSTGSTATSPSTSSPR